MPNSVITVHCPQCKRELQRIPSENYADVYVPADAPCSLCRAFRKEQQ